MKKLFVILLALFCYGCAGYVPSLVDGVCGPVVVPMRVVDASDYDVSQGDIEEAIDLWNKVSPTPLLQFWNPLPDAQPGTIYIQPAFQPDEDDCSLRLDCGEWGVVRGLARMHLSSDGETVSWCEVQVSSEILYHSPTVVAVLAHEMGHCLGLDDGPHGVRDGEGIMREPGFAGDEPTQEEAQTILDGCEE